MILRCPECFTSFRVPDGAIGAVGRRVRCASCKHMWHAVPAEAVSPRAAVPSPAEMATQQVRPSPAALDPVMAEKSRSLRAEMLRDDPEDDENTDDFSKGLDEEEGLAADGTDTAGEDTSFTDGIRAYADKLGLDLDEDPDDLTAEDLVDEGFEDGFSVSDLSDVDEDDLRSEDALVRLRARERRERTEKSRNVRRKFYAAGWGLLVLIWTAVPLVFFGFEDKVRDLWPASELLYDSVKGNSDLEKLKAGEENLSPAVTDAPNVLRAVLDPTRTEERGGETVLILTGYVENAGQRSARVPKLRITILDARGQILDEWKFDPPGLVLTRGQRLRFRQERGPVPAGANQASIEPVEGEYSDTEAESPLLTGGLTGG